MAVDFTRDPILEANPKTYDAFLELMAKFRMEMNKYKSNTNEYNYWRATIKELRVRAIEQNIDAYSLEVDTHHTVLVASKQPEITKQQQIIDKANEEIKKAGGTPDYAAVLSKQTQIIDAAKEEIRKLNNEIQAGLSESDQQFYHNMIKEAHVVKELVDVRRQYDTATDEEKKVLASRAEQLRLEAIAILDAVGSNTKWQRDDLERRVWYMYTGENIAEPRFGEADTRTEEQKKLWAGHQALMEAASNKYNTYNTNDKANLVPQDELWEQIRQKESEHTKNLWRERTYETFSGADMVVYFAFPGYKPIDVGVASLISYSLYREKKQIRTVGAINTKGITKGPRTISGRMVMTVVREHFVEAIKREIPYMRTIRNMLMDELPPFDILVSFGNEYGAAATLVIHGVTLVDEQKTLTVEDLYTENIFTYLARDIDVMKNVFANYTDEYDPMQWMSSSFMPDGSEILGDFYPKDLELTQSAGLLSDPEPFYGAISGWNATLYNLMYTGTSSSGLSIDSNGNLVNSDSSGGSSGGTATPEGDGGGSTGGGSTNNDTLKIHPAKEFLWVKNVDKVKENKQLEYISGWMGYMNEDVGKQFNMKNDPTTRLWGRHQLHRRSYSVADSSYFKFFNTHSSLKTNITNMLENYNIVSGTDDLKITLQMFNKMKHVGSTWSRDLEPSGTTDVEYWVEMSFSYFSPQKHRFKNGTSMHKKSSNDHRERSLAVAGFWNVEMPHSTLIKLMNADTSSTASAANKYWVNTVSENKAQHGITTKNSKVGGISKSQKASFIASQGSHRINADGKPVWIKISKNGTDIDLKKYLWFVSTIGRTGERYMLSFDDLPAGATVLVRFKYNPNKPSTPSYSDGDTRFLYLTLTKKNDNRKRGETTFFKYTDLQQDYSLARWELYNKPDWVDKKN